MDEFHDDWGFSSEDDMHCHGAQVFEDHENMTFMPPPDEEDIARAEEVEARAHVDVKSFDGPDQPKPSLSAHSFFRSTPTQCLDEEFSETVVLPLAAQGSALHGEPVASTSPSSSSTSAFGNLLDSATATPTKRKQCCPAVTEDNEPLKRKRLTINWAEKVQKSKQVDTSSLVPSTTPRSIRDRWICESIKRRTWTSDSPIKSYQGKKKFLRDEWARMTEEQRRMATRAFLASNAENEPKTEAAGLKPHSVVEGPHGRHLFCHGVLLTWNSNDLAADTEFKGMVTQLANLDPNSQLHDDLFNQIRSLRVVQFTGDQFTAWFLSKVGSLKRRFVRWSIQLELNFHAEELGRVHWHAAVTDLSQPILKWDLKDTYWEYKKTLPDYEYNSGRGASLSKSLNRAHAYCQVQKIGALFKMTNYPKGDRFVCESRWTMAWWKQRKLSHAGAAKEIIENRCGVNRALQEIELVENKEKEMRDEKERVAVEKKLEGCMATFRCVPAVNKWKCQFGRSFHGKKTRFTFLVLVGATRLGKTQFALSLFGRTQTLVCNCQGKEEPNVTKFDRARHKAILYDEATAGMVVKNKQMFQAGVEGTWICESRCQQFARWKWLYQVAMIVSTNVWEYDALSSEEAAWLQDNSVVFHVKEKLFV